MTNNTGAICFNLAPEALLKCYDEAQRKVRNFRNDPEPDLAVCKLRIIRGVILARLLDLKPPFMIDEQVYADGVTVALNSTPSAKILPLRHQDRVADYTYDEKFGWLLLLETQGKLHLFKASDFKKENQLSRHALSSHESPTT